MEFVRHPRARRYVIRVRADGSVRVTLPRWGSRRHAELFALQQRPWPGNVRELRNAVERLLILAQGKEVTSSDVGRLLTAVYRAATTPPAGAPGEGKAGSFEEFKSEAERNFLLAKLREYHWNVAETARALDMPRSNLYKKIERYALTREST